jgi:hypothetical protein
MEQTYVVSSTIDCLGYVRNTLFVRFKSGCAYSYDKAGYGVFDALRKAESAGSSFHRLIKGKYRYTRLGYDPFVAKKDNNVARHSDERFGFV